MLGNIWLMNPGAQGPYDTVFWLSSGTSPGWMWTAVSLLPDWFINYSSSQLTHHQSCLGETEKTGVPLESILWMCVCTVLRERGLQCQSVSLTSVYVQPNVNQSHPHRHPHTHFHLTVPARLPKHDSGHPSSLSPPLAHVAPATHQTS